MHVLPKSFPLNWLPLALRAVRACFFASWTAFAVLAWAAPASAADNRPLKPDGPPLEWQEDYGSAYAKAKDEQKMLLVHFQAERDTPKKVEFIQTLQDPRVRKRCRECVLLRVPVSYQVTLGDESQPLLEHGAFAAMGGKPGLAMIDLKHSGRGHYGHTVSAVPFGKPAYYAPEYWTVEAVLALLRLPPGTLTQRSMVYAVQLHPEKPASVRGRPEPYLFAECEGHCQYQARTGVQGHQGFNARFQRITANIGGSGASEVVAESWSGESLLQACFSCVQSWRGSPGHWSAVSSPQAAYGYDIKRSSSGTWYATGLFGG